MTRPDNLLQIVTVTVAASNLRRRARPLGVRRRGTSRRRALPSASSAGTTPSAPSTATTPTPSAIAEKARVRVSEERDRSPLSSRVTCRRSCSAFLHKHVPTALSHVVNFNLLQKLIIESANTRQALTCQTSTTGHLISFK